MTDEEAVQGQPVTFHEPAPSAEDGGDQSEPQDASRSTTEARQARHAQAQQFLEVVEIKAASREKKTAFLKQKGLSDDEIGSLLDGEGDAPGDVSASDASANRASSNTIETSSSPPSTIPPIITYPEYLLHAPPPPPPMLTTTRLRNTLYLFGGLVALLHGTKRYLYTPMLEALTEARLSYASTVQQNLMRLNKRLEEQVSVLPPALAKRLQDVNICDGMESDSTGDPTEVFHRDVAVQTSLPASPITSGQATPYCPIAFERQAEQILNVKKLLTSLHSDQISEGQDTDELKTTLDMLREYCESLAYVAPSSTSQWQHKQRSDRNEDEFDRFKKNIRSLKGMLLSTKSFPALKAPT